MAALSAACVALSPSRNAPSRLNGIPGLAGPQRRNAARLRIISAKAALQQVDVTKVVPQSDRVLIRLEELPEKSVGGVLLPKSAVKFEHYLCGEVLSVGKEAASINKGQKVLFSDLNAYEVNLGTTEKLCFCRAGDLLAVVE